MPQQQFIPESERLKSSVNVDANASTRPQGFEVGDEVRYEVKETTKDGTLCEWKTFTIASAQRRGSSWEYQLNENKELYNAGAWIPEVKLRSPV